MFADNEIMWIVIIGFVSFIIWIISAIIKNYSSENEALTAKYKNLEKLNELNEKTIKDLKIELEYFKSEKQQMIQFQNEKLAFEKLKQQSETEIKNKRKELLDKYYEKKDTLAFRLKDYEKKLLVEKSQSQQWLAGMIADFLTLPIDYEIERLKKSNSQQKWDRAFKITDLKREIKCLTEKNKMLEYELKYLYTLYPELEDAEIELDDNLPVATSLEENGWLTKEEWESLSDLERNELAYDRYKNRHKTKWQIGRDFEMFVGYQYETQKHYSIEYHGIKHGLKDLGIDLIAKKKNETLIIQCKYWSIKKEIHENYICQLYGTSIKYQLEHPTEKTIPVFVCHNELSDIAKAFAQKLGIEVHEKIELGEYPAIKCNPDSMIYHLPFDLSYDNTEKCIKVMTVAEAENLGYRRSYKWHGISLQ